MFFEIAIKLTCVLSISGAALMLYFYYGYKQYNFTQKLVCYLQFSDLVFALFMLLYVKPGNNPNPMLCTIQGLVTQAASVASFIFNFFMAYCIYQNIILNRKDMQQRYKYKVKHIGFGIPILIALLPLLWDGYQSQYYACGLTILDPNGQFVLSALIQKLAIFYLPLLALNAITIFYILRVLIFVRKLQKYQKNKNQMLMHDNYEAIELKMTKSIVVHMLAFPLIQLLCWSGSLLNSLVAIWGVEIWWMESWRFVMADMQGFLNAIAFQWLQYKAHRIQSRQQEQEIELPELGSQQGSQKYVNERNEDELSVSSFGDLI